MFINGIIILGYRSAAGLLILGSFNDHTTFLDMGKQFEL
jgi:hypothetical protein